MSVLLLLNLYWRKMRIIPKLLCLFLCIDGRIGWRLSYSKHISRTSYLICSLLACRRAPPANVIAVYNSDGHACHQFVVLLYRRSFALLRSSIGTMAPRDNSILWTLLLMGTLSGYGFLVDTVYTTVMRSLLQRGTNMCNTVLHTIAYIATFNNLYAFNCSFSRVLQPF